MVTNHIIIMIIVLIMIMIRNITIRVTCLPSGSWDAAPPDCLKIVCPDIHALVNMMMMIIEMTMIIKMTSSS